jgi:hypothetical protein
VTSQTIFFASIQFILQGQLSGLKQTAIYAVHAMAFLPSAETHLVEAGHRRL